MAKSKSRAKKSSTQKTNKLGHPKNQVLKVHRGPPGEGGLYKMIAFDEKGEFFCEWYGGAGMVTDIFGDLIATETYVTGRLQKGQLLVDNRLTGDDAPDWDNNRGPSSRLHVGDYD